MQDSNRPITSRTLPRLGQGLAAFRSWENDFRMLAAERGFTELNLPLSLPANEFVSRLSGVSILADAPRFVDSNATEWALRSDLTLFAAQFISQNKRNLLFPFQFFYSGKVFSPQGLLGAEGFKLGHASEFESFEFGAEIVGQPGGEAELSVLDLATTALKAFGYKRIRLVLGDIRLVRLIEAELSGCLETSGADRSLRQALLSKDYSRLNGFFGGHSERAIARLQDSDAFLQLGSTAERMRVLFPDLEVQIDPLMTRRKNFYSGLIFDFWAEDADGRLHSVGGGGRYDQLFEHFGESYAAAGFMIRDPNTAGVGVIAATEQPSDAGSLGAHTSDLRQTPVRKRVPVRIALPKGRLQKWGIDVFRRIGICPVEDPETTRKLAIRSVCGLYEFLLVKNADVVSYVERGIADLALAGSDVIDEEANSLLRPVTFEFGRCKICLAGKPSDTLLGNQFKRARVATKYPNQALRLLRDRGIQAEIIPLQGSVELASVISFCDAIVDLVETGKTLRENDLIIYDELTHTRVQLIMSRSYFVESDHLFRHWLKCWQSDSTLVKPHFELTTSEPKQHDSNSKDL